MFNLILSITGSLSAFEPAYMVGSMGANSTADFFIKIHQMTYVSNKVGMAMALMILILLFSADQRLCEGLMSCDTKSRFMRDFFDEARSKGVKRPKAFHGICWKEASKNPEA